MTNTTFYLHSMGTKNSGVNNESKQYLTRKITGAFQPDRGQDLTAHASVHSSTTPKATVSEIHTGRSFQPYMEMQSTA